MKFLFSLMIFATGVVGADEPKEVPLNSKSISVNSDSVILIRDSNSERKVQVTLQVPFTVNQCVKTDVQSVEGKSPICGNSLEYKYTCQTDYSCHDVSGSCEIYEPNCTPAVVCNNVERCSYALTKEDLTCVHPELVCSAFETAGKIENLVINLSFVRSTKLKSGETERFLLRGLGDEENRKFPAKLSLVGGPEKYFYKGKHGGERRIILDLEVSK